MGKYIGIRPLNEINKGGLTEDVIAQQFQFTSSFSGITFYQPDKSEFIFVADLNPTETALLDQILAEHDKQFWDDFDDEAAKYPGGSADEIFFEPTTQVPQTDVQSAIDHVEATTPKILEDLSNVDPNGQGTNGTNGTNGTIRRTTSSVFNSDTIEYNLVRNELGVWNTTTPKQSPIIIGNTVEFDSNYTVTIDNKNDVLSFIGKSAILTLPNVIGIDANFSVTINNNGTDVLIVLTANSFLNVSARRTTVIGQNNKSYFLQPNSNAVIKVESTGWGIITETAEAVSRVRGLEISLGFLSSNVIDKNVSGSTIIDPFIANNWITTITANTVFNITISQNPDNLTYINFTLTLKQNTVGGHNVTFFEDLNLRWHNNQSIQVPRFPNSIVKIEFSSYDAGLTWIAFEVFRLDSDETTTNLTDTDTNRWIIKQTESRIGLAVLSNAYINSATLSYKFLASASVATAAEINVYVNDTNVNTFVTSSFFEDIIIAEDVIVTELWNIDPGDEVYITVKETSGNTSVQIDVKGDLQQSILTLSNVIEEEIPQGTDGTSGQIPGVDYRVEDTYYHVINTVDTDIGLNIVSTTVLETATLSFVILSSANFTTSNEIKIKVDGIVKYSEIVSGIFKNTEIKRDIDIIPNWNILSNSTISVTCRETSGNTSVILDVLGNVQPSVLLISNGIEIETPPEGTDGTSGTSGTIPPSIPDLKDTDNQEHLLTIDDSEIGLEIITPVDILEADLEFSFLAGSAFSSSCEAKVKINNIQVYSEIIGVSGDTQIKRLIPFDDSWGVDTNSRIVITARETSGAAVDMKVKGDVQISTLTIANINGGIPAGTNGTSGTDGTSGEIPPPAGTDGTDGEIPPSGTDGGATIPDIVDTDNQEHPLVVTDSEIGLEIISPVNVAEAKLGFSISVGSAISSSCEVKVKIDNIEIFAETVSNILDDTDISRIIIVDPTWIIQNSRIIVTARETTGAAVSMKVKGNVQISTLFLNDIIVAPSGTDGTAGGGNPCDGVQIWVAGDHWTTYTVGDLRVDVGGLYELHTQSWAQTQPSEDTSSLGWTFIQNCN